MRNSPPSPDVPEAPRPWYREPWPWVLIALPAAAVVGCMISLWLAISHPDFLVVDEIEYTDIQSAIKAAPPAISADPGAGDSRDTTLDPGTDQP